jgi:hypothetical protein
MLLYKFHINWACAILLFKISPNTNEFIDILGQVWIKFRSVVFGAKNLAGNLFAGHNPGCWLAHRIIFAWGKQYFWLSFLICSGLKRNLINCLRNNVREKKVGACRILTLSEAEWNYINIRPQRGPRGLCLYIKTKQQAYYTSYIFDTRSGSLRWPPRLSRGVLYAPLFRPEVWSSPRRRHYDSWLDSWNNANEAINTPPLGLPHNTHNKKYSWNFHIVLLSEIWKQSAGTSLLTNLHRHNAARRFAEHPAFSTFVWRFACVSVRPILNFIVDLSLTEAFNFCVRKLFAAMK